MKFLCLHGTYGNADTFRTQLSQFVEAFERLDNPRNLKFKWINGGYDATPPKSFESYFGAPPFLRFIDFGGIEAVDDLLEKIQHMPQGKSADDTIRESTTASVWTTSTIRECMERLFLIVDNDPEIDGILGYSEGCTAAAAFIVEEKRRWEEEGRQRRMKLGIFFSGWLPVRIKGDTVELILSDEGDTNLIDVPTIHIIGAKDPYLHGSMALFNTCQEDMALLFDHGKGHALPRDERTLRELSLAVNSAADSAMM